LAAIPTGQLRRAAILRNLAASLFRLHSVVGDNSILRDIVALYREAVAETPADRPIERAGRLMGLAGSLSELYDVEPSRELDDEMLRVAREAVAITPSDHPTLATRRMTLGSGLMTRYARDFDIATYTEAVQALRAAVASGNATPPIRITAARNLAIVERLAGEYDNALSAYESIIGLLPIMVTRSLARTDREHWLGRQTGLASEVAATAVAADRPERAVELLEQCRGFLLNEAMDDRRDLTALRAISPRLAEQVEDVRGRLMSLPTGSPIDIDSTFDHPATAEAVELGELRQALTGRWAALLQEIRALPGFERYLAPPDIDQLCELADAGPIVLLYTMKSSNSGGALIISAEKSVKVRALTLPGLGYASVTGQLERLATVLRLREGTFAERLRAEEQLHEVLEWLWDKVTGPVLTDLGFGEQVEPAPRMWWCPVGKLAELPIQAAGYHRGPGANTVLDRTVSSLIATVRTLEHNRARPNSTRSSAVVIALPETADAPELPGAAREAADIEALIRNSHVLHGPAATRHTVAEALVKHPIAHFACHALAQLDVPTSSRLLLHDHRTDPLTVDVIERLNLADAELAYLSACSTTRTNHELIDESIHLTAALHLAGYRHVVGTLWPVNDSAAAEIAASFYRYLTTDGSEPAQTQLSAHALNTAVRGLRDQRRNFPSQWAGHLHYGV
jgi:hypothetical protein